MRSLVTLALLTAACASRPVDGASPPTHDLSMPGDPDLGLAADCPMAFESPPYCFSGPQGTAASCGPCANVGELCDYFEATLICAGDHQWRCYWAGGVSSGCPHGDGGA